MGGGWGEWGSKGYCFLLFPQSQDLCGGLHCATDVSWHAHTQTDRFSFCSSWEGSSYPCEYHRRWGGLVQLVSTCTIGNVRSKFGQSSAAVVLVPLNIHTGRTWEAWGLAPGHQGASSLLRCCRVIPGQVFPSDVIGLVLCSLAPLLAPSVAALVYR